MGGPERSLISFSETRVTAAYKSSSAERLHIGIHTCARTHRQYISIFCKLNIPQMAIPRYSRPQTYVMLSLFLLVFQIREYTSMCTDYSLLKWCPALIFLSPYTLTASIRLHLTSENVISGSPPFFF